MKILSTIRTGANQIMLSTDKGPRLLTSKGEITQRAQANLIANCQRFGFRDACMGVGRVNKVSKPA